MPVRLYLEVLEIGEFRVVSKNPVRQSGRNCRVFSDRRKMVEPRRGCRSATV
jgi:hypothetical protein